MNVFTFMLRGNCATTLVFAIKRGEEENQFIAAATAMRCRVAVAVCPRADCPA